VTLACHNEIRKNNAQGITLIDSFVYRNKRFQTAVYWKIITQETLKENVCGAHCEMKGVRHQMPV